MLPEKPSYFFFFKVALWIRGVHYLNQMFSAITAYQLLTRDTVPETVGSAQGPQTPDSV